MNKNTKYFYYFRGNLDTHVQFYAGWAKEANKRGVPLKLITTLNINKYFKNYQKIRKIKSETPFVCIPTFPLIDKTIISLYFIVNIINSKKVIIHLRKRDPKIFEELKKYFKNLKYIIDLEGDPKSERDFLLEHPYKEGFYDKIIGNMNKEIQAEKEKIEKAEYIFCCSEKFKCLLAKRYPQLDNKIGVLPTGVDTNKFYYDKNIRDKKRSELDLKERFVIIYCGNAFYSWENVYRTIEIYKLIRNKESNAYLILLIRKQDKPIVEGFLNKLNISSSEYLLTNVENDEVSEYLNASDLGVVLRHDHIMNEVSSPGKFGEYASCGLPILTTKGISNYSNLIEKSGYGIVLKNMDDDKEIVEKLSFQGLMSIDRYEYSNWATKHFSNNAYGEQYVEILKNMN
ncbi:MAG: glycosyltransferase [Methanosarcina sp.]